ncbi:PREDICTED: uncharacterized protein LOC109462601 [Branchiostoma belcheri]|uniref:Uncharacterized protein LOC109462601 n=1 Tax=Branchiostoma belcheri TaxID=7741 RepID=A0A6P4Y7K3_BRABE|nr:PREDICTED: uncharacterized protein LOC109462601 [Branchiostoma belcheri]
MKGLVFVVAVALACCVTTCGALECPICNSVISRAECMRQPRQTCNASGIGIFPTPVCLTIQNKTAVNETWSNSCSTEELCIVAQKFNPVLCQPTRNTFTCYSCCDTDGCVGQPAAASAARISAVTMTTAALAVLMKNAAGF